MDKIIIDWNKIITVLVTAIIPAIISFIVSKMNIKTEKENINKQIEAEIKKVKIQYELAQKKDNANYLNKLKVEKLAKLYPAVAKFNNGIAILSEFTINSIDYFKNSIPLSEEEINIYKNEREEIKNMYIDENLIAEISTLAVYFPNIKEEWDTVIFRYPLYIEIYPKYLLKGEKDLEVQYRIYEELYKGIYDMPKNYNINKCKQDLENLNLRTKNIGNLISEEINKTMNTLNESV